MKILGKNGVTSYLIWSTEFIQTTWGNSNKLPQCFEANDIKAYFNMLPDTLV
jgi:hypothetical protein